MTGFGASAPYKDLYRHFGITAEAVAEKVLGRIISRHRDEVACPRSTATEALTQRQPTG